MAPGWVYIGHGLYGTMFDGFSLGLYWPWAIREMFDGSRLGVYWPWTIREMFDGFSLGLYWPWALWDNV